MAAASSGDPGGSKGRRLPAYMDPTNKFGELTFLQLTGKDGAPLPRNPFLIGKSVEVAAGGPIEGANTEAQGTKYTLKVRDPTQVRKLLKMTALYDETEVIVQPHPNLNVSRCVISCFDIIDMEEKDVLVGLLSQGVIQVRRITRNEGGKKVNTPALILTFGKTTYPEHIKIGLLHVPTRPYFPNPMLCYNCFTYGHTRARCPGPQRCFNCSGEHLQVEGEECSDAAFCCNCKSNHRPTNRQCPLYKHEMEVIKIKVRDNLTFPEARKRAEQQKSGSYAQATAQESATEKKLRELETMMKKKDEEIKRLLEEAKKREEKMEQMFAYIKQIKEQTSHVQEKAHHSKEMSQITQQSQKGQSQTSQKSGPTTRSRNNSPVVQESKRGRPQHPTITLPKNPSKSTASDRLSPPLKKVALNNDTMETQDPVYSDEEVEIAETPSSQRLR